MPISRSSQSRRPKKNSVKKRLKVALSRPSETTKSKSKKLEPLSTRQKRAIQIVSLLKRYYPNAKCSLDYQNPYQLIAATMLSAQCTDKRVNMVTPELFSKYPTPQDLSQARLDDVEQIVRTTGFYKNKARNLIECAKTLVACHDGNVPTSMDELSSLAGVGRKTANVVLGNAFGVPAMVVDTHVTRLSNLLGLAQGQDAVKLEKELETVIEKKDWVEFSHLLIEHGRQVCVARRPKCQNCFLSELCPSAQSHT